ncbi:MAG: GatB/YqeY domain-containing protein [Bacteroidetes bacterium]|nr:GatB/YqeY domain-containing protein [Bacteroidota bacterium]
MLTETLTQDLKKAMLAKDRVLTRTIRSLKAALLDKEIELRTGGVAEVSDDVALAVLQKQAKQRRDSIEQFEKAGRDDLAATEREELDVIQSYLPEQLSEEEIRKEVLAVIEETEATSMKDMGRVMGPIMSRLKGKADGRMVQSVVKESLSA